MATFNATFENDKTFNATFEENQQMNASFGQVQIVETGDYENLINQPSIEDTVLKGNKTIDQIGVGTLTVQEIERILYLD